MKLYRLLILVGLVTPVIHADTWTDPKTNITWTYFVHDNGVTIMSGDPILGLSGCSSQASSVIIPAQINSLPVTTLGIYAFRGCPLSEVHIPASVNTIMETAFLECNNLKEFIVNENNTTFCSLNGQLFTKDMTTLLFARNVQGEYKLPQGVTTIGYTAFLGCSSLTSVDIPSSVTSIGDSAFSGCSSLTSVVIPEGVTSINSGAFSGCSALTSVDIPASVTSINGWAFEDCSALTSVVIPEGVTYIDLTAFSGCTSLTSLTIPKSVIRLGGYTSPGLNCKIIFLGYPPNRLGSIRWNDHIEYPSAYAEEWEHALLLARRSGGCNTGALVSVRAEMTTPKTMKVTYKVITFSRAKVRAVAWKDGVRSFANIIPVKTAAEGSPETVPNGEAVTAGVEHTFIWQVSADWNIDLAKVAVEVLAEDAGLLPQDLVTIPATEAHVAMTITTNVPTTYHLFNALVWHYADGDPALTVSNGVVKIIEAAKKYSDFSAEI